MRRLLDARGHLLQNLICPPRSNRCADNPVAVIERRREAIQDNGLSRYIVKQGSAGAPERIRTSDPQIRSLVLYPAELRAPEPRRR